MKSISSLLSALLLMALVGLNALPLWAQEGVLLKARLGTTNYCHMQFPAIREDTLYWDRPVLKDPKSGDIIDFYGSCDYDPLGKAAVEAQKLELRRRLQVESE